MHVSKFTYRFAWRRTRGEVIVDNGPRFLKTQKLALPPGSEGRIEVKENKRDAARCGPMHPATMIIASCSFHGTAHDHPKISVCNGISSFLSPVATRQAFLRRCFSSAFRPSGTGTRNHWLSLDDRARVAAYLDIARSKNYIYLIVTTERGQTVY